MKHDEQEPPASDSLSFDPLVVAVVLNWNGFEDTKACIASLASSGIARLECVVVDNASTDDSRHRLEQLLPPGRLVASRVNGGYGAGNNLGIRWALDRGADYVWILNNDTVVSPGAGQMLLDAAESNPGVGAIGCKLVSLYDPSEVQLIGGGVVNWFLGTVRPAKTHVKVDYVSGASLFLRSTALRDVGLFDECFFMYFEDVDLSLRMRQMGFELLSVPEALVLHKGGASLEPSSAFGARHFNQSAIRFFDKHSNMPTLPKVLGVLGRTIKQFVRGRPRIAASLLAILLDGVSSSRPCFGTQDVQRNPTGT